MGFDLKQYHVFFCFQVKCQPPPLSLYRQLVWREFFFTLASQNPNMDKAVDNPLSLNITWEDNEKALEAWKKVYSYSTLCNQTCMTQTYGSLSTAAVTSAPTYLQVSIWKSISNSYVHINDNYILTDVLSQHKASHQLLECVSSHF